MNGPRWAHNRTTINTAIPFPHKETPVYQLIHGGVFLPGLVRAVPFLFLLFLLLFLPLRKFPLSLLALVKCLNVGEQAPGDGFQHMAGDARM